MKTECSIVRDLLPLYVEDMVSAETARYINEHLKVCHECQAELASLKDGESLGAVEKIPTEHADRVRPFKKIMKRMNRQLYTLSYTLIVIFIFLGFSLTGGEHLMYNSIIMPIVGIFGYYVFRWKAVYKLPLLLFFIDLFVFLFQLVEIGFKDTVAWTVIYSAFAAAGILIAFLLHVAFGKETEK